MTTDQFRTSLVSDYNAILDAPWIVRKLMTAEHIRRVKAQKRYWQEAPDAELIRLAALLDQEPLEEPQPAPTALEADVARQLDELLDEWRKT